MVGVCNGADVKMTGRVDASSGTDVVDRGTVGALSWMIGTVS